MYRITARFKAKEPFTQASIHARYSPKLEERTTYL